MAPTLSAAALNRISSQIIGCAMDVHRTFGSALLESAYRACLCVKLSKAGLRLECEKPIPLVFEGATIECAYRADLIVEGAVIVEVKAAAALAPVHERQLKTYLRLANCHLGLILNFGAPTMKAGIKRVVNNFPDEST